MPAQDVLTQHNDNSRSGAYLTENQLKPATVNAHTFGKLYERTVEGDIYAQPLYVSGVATAQGTKNLFFIATSTNRVYAFDADEPSTDPHAGVIWNRQLDPWRPFAPNAEICLETQGTVGITSTPVIDRDTQTMYVVTRRSQGAIAADKSNLYQLHNDGTIWRYTGTPLSGWQLLDTNPATVQIAAAGGILYQRHRDGTIWRYTGTPLTGWQLLDNNSATVQIVADESDLYQLHNDGTIWRYTGTPLSGWQLLDNNPATVQIAAAGGILYQLHNDGTIWRYTGTPLTGWQLLDNNPATVQIVAGESDLYQLHNDGTIWRYTGTPLSGWQLLDNNPATVQIAAAGGILYQRHAALKADGHTPECTIWRYTGTPLTGWQLLDDDPATVQIIAAGGVLYQLHLTGAIWRYTGTPVTGWQLLDNNPAVNDGANYLHALNIADGAERLNSPVKIEATAPDAPTVRFDARCQRNRPGLLLLNGVVYIAFATFSCDAGCPGGVPYHGWVLGYRTSDLSRVAAYCTSPTGGGAGVWQSGKGLVGSDDGTIYFETGNDFNDETARLGDSFVKLQTTSAAPGLVFAGSFTPSNASTLRNGDTDLGSGGPLLLPGGRLLGGGKQGRLYVLDPRTMALTQDTTAQVIGGKNVGEGFQAFINTWHPEIPIQNYGDNELYGPNIHGGPVYWQGTGYIYHMPEKDYMKAFAYDQTTGRLRESPALVAAVRPPDGMPGGFSSISANGGRDGIVWTSFPHGNGQWNKVPGTLIAFDATSLAELWRDDEPIVFAKFCPPTIANGRVYRATFASDVGHGVPGSVVVYGLLHG